jgi:hypothetical protein
MSHPLSFEHGARDWLTNYFREFLSLLKNAPLSV